MFMRQPSKAYSLQISIGCLEAFKTDNPFIPKFVVSVEENIFDVY